MKSYRRENLEVEPGGTDPRSSLTKVIISCLRTLKEHPEDVGTLMALAEAYMQKGEVIRSLEVLKRCEAIDRTGKVKMMEGLCYYHQGLLDKAEEAFCEAVRRDPGNALAYNNLGVVYGERDEWARAAEMYRSALECQRDTPLFLTNLGVALAELGEKEEALHCYRKALEIDPNYTTAHYCMGMETYKNGLIDAGSVVSVGSLMRVSGRSPMAGTPWQKVCSTRVEEITDSHIAIQAPMERGEVVPFRPGQNIILAIPLEDGLYAFHTKVLDRKKGHIPMLYLQNPGPSSRRIQRRKFFRVRSQALKEIKPISSEQKGVATYLSGQIRDRNLSAGGILIHSRNPITRGSLLQLDLNLPDGILKAAGQVVRVMRLEDGSYDIGVRFVGLNQKQRLRITRYVYTRQVELHRKGL